MKRLSKREFETYSWVHEGVVELSHFEPLRPIEVTLLQKLSEHGITTGKLLEIGCSYGRAGLPFAQQGFEVTGIEKNLAAVRKFNRIARKNSLPARAYYKKVEQYDLGDKEWRVLICEYTTHCMTSGSGFDLLDRIIEATQIGGFNLISVFTSTGETFTKTELENRCFPPEGYLQSHYSRLGWEILNFTEGAEPTKRGPLQIASQIITRRI